MLRSIAQKLHFRVTIWQSSFDSPAYSISADKRMPAGWHCVREFVKVDHPEYAHIIDNKLMDGVGVRVLALAAWHGQTREHRAQERHQRPGTRCVLQP